MVDTDLLNKVTQKNHREQSKNTLCHHDGMTMRARIQTNII
jgi:hypothetical protein